jgi:hypothetical protein
MSLAKQTVVVKTLLIERSGGREVVLNNPGEQMLYASYLPVQQDASGAAVIGDGNDTEMVTAFVLARFERRLSGRLIHLYGDFLPPTPETLQGVDQVLLCGNRLAGDGAGVAALRRWLYDGGNLWIALDRVDPATVSLLLGDGVACHVVDRVGLTEWNIVGTSRSEREEARTAPPQRIGDLDRPVEMVRVEAPGLRITHTVNDWPAALWLPAGKGKVLITTLEGRAWVRPRLKTDLPALEPQNPAAGFIATEPLRRLSLEFPSQRQRPTFEPRNWSGCVSEQVGYRIVGRAPVAAVLGVFCLGLLVLGIRLARRDRLARLGWIGPAAALGTALILVLMGQLSRRSVPSTAVTAQFVEAAPHVADLRVHGLLALYNQQESSEPLGVRDGGILFPDHAQQNQSAAQRMVWTDLGAWHWENLSLPAGLHLAPFEYATKTGQPLAARVTFGPRGLAGTWEPGPFQDTADALIAIPGERNLAVRLASGGTFTAGPDDVLAPGQFLAATVLSDEQRRRRMIYEKLLADPKRPYPSQPMFLAWAAPLDMKFHVPHGARQTGAALVAIPLELQRPEPGSRLLIPSPFLAPRPVLMADATSSWYNPSLHSWLGPSQRGGHMMMRYQLPPEILPVRLERAMLSINLTAPSRTLTITTAIDGNIVSLATRDSPAGTIRVEVGADQLRLDAQGGVLLGIKIGAHPSSSATAPEWKINEVQLQLEGQALEP